MSGRGKVKSARNTSQVYITQSECNNASQVSEAHTLGIFRHKCYCFGFYTYLFPGKSKIRETGCGKFFPREIPSRLSRQFPDFKRMRQALALCDPFICWNPKCIILSLTQRLKFIYPIPSIIMCVFYLFFSPKNCKKLRILIECEH